MNQNITAKIVADSTLRNSRLTSFILTYPRFIHSELMTHRVFSRNAASSRAIPIEKVMAAVSDYPAHPERWGTNGRGMQDHGNHTDTNDCVKTWRTAVEQALGAAADLEALGLHKQIVNRVLEPFSHITVLVTATEWDNFFRLRAHSDAQPEFQVLAYRMLHEYLNHDPEELSEGEWHLPLVSEEEKQRLSNVDKRIVSVANAARVSYTSFDMERGVESQLALASKLMQSGHWSPFEHQALAASESYAAHYPSNFKGSWVQYRQLVVGKSSPLGHRALQEILDGKPDWVTLENDQ